MRVVPPLSLPQQSHYRAGGPAPHSKADLLNVFVGAAYQIILVRGGVYRQYRKER